MKWIAQTGPVLACLFVSGCSGSASPAVTTERNPKMVSLQLTSSAIEPGQPIPRRFTADGEDLSPPLAWSAVPPQTRSLAILCDDPDAPRGDWVHWVLYNLPGGVQHLEEGKVPAEAVAGINDFRKPGYNGPSPPAGKPHRYVFHLFALDTTLGLPAGASKAQLLQAIDGHVLGQGELTATYQRR